jgi:diaminopimelate epimerase
MIFGGREMKGTAVSMGNPHIVFYLDDIEKAPAYVDGTAH